MNEDSPPVFKTFRAVWVPVSIYSVSLAAGAAGVFWLVTWASCLSAGHGSMATPAVRAFFPASLELMLSGGWPGHDVALREDGRVVHGLMAGEETTLEEESQAREDQRLMGRLLGGYMRRRVLEIDADRSLSRGEQEAERRRLQWIPERYQWIYLVQLVAFYLLWAVVGVAICRIQALRTGRDELCSAGSALRFSWASRARSLLYPAALLIPVLFLAVCNAALGAAGSIPWVGWLLGPVMLVLMLVTGVVMAVIGIAGAAGIGFHPAAVAVEGRGIYDCIGRAFGYLFSRPLQVLLHLGLAYVLVFHVIHPLFLEQGIVERVLEATVTPFYGSRFDDVLLGRVDRLEGGAWFFGAACLAVLTLFRLLVWGVVITYVLGTFTSTYLALRQEVDGIEPADLVQDPGRTRGDEPPPPPAPEPTPPPPETDEPESGGDGQESSPAEEGGARES